ncbi:MAG: hypothetical protein NT106_05410 [Candidatus Sumerlaeota bacterium]|nr:hypothetical protein [Candidatus Sumerlaeota bacterium]
MESSVTEGDYAEILGRLRHIRRRIKSILLLEGFIRSAIFFLPILLIFFLVDNFLSLAAPLRLAGILTLITSIIAVFLRVAWAVFIPWSSERTAISLEKVYPELDNHLINAVQLGSRWHSCLVECLMKQTLLSFARINLSRAPWMKNLKRDIVILFGIILLALFYPLIFPEGFYNATERFLSPLGAISPLSQTSLLVRPGDVTVAKGDDLAVSAEVSGTLVHEAMMDIKTPAERAEIPMAFDGMRFNGRQQGVTAPLRYRVRAGDAVSPWYHVQVVEKPAVEEIRISYHYPPYTGFKNETASSSDGNINAPAGTDAELYIKATKPISAAELVFSETHRHGLEIVSDLRKAASGHIILKESGTYRIHLTDDLQYTNDPSPQYTITVRQDQPPRITLISPTGEVQAHPTAPLPILFRARDDYGIVRITPQIAKKEPSDFQSLAPLEINPRHLEMEDGYALDLKDAAAGETLYFRMAAYDNRPDPSPNESLSEILKIIIPSDGKEPKTKQDRETLEKLTRLKEKTEEFKEIQTKVIQTTQELLKKSPKTWTSSDDFKTSEIAALEDTWARFFEDAHSDLSKLPKLVPIDTALIQDTLDIYQEVKKVPDSLLPKPRTISVTEEQTGLELAKELTAHLEKWLPDEPDRIKWEMKEPSKDYEVPLTKLPDELEDIVGDLIEKEDDFTDAIEDVSSSWADSIDKGAGWEASDGPISNYSAQGVTGNILPNANEIGGRAGEGRSGRSHGEFVEGVARGKEGRKTPTRLTNDPFESGVVRDEMKDMTTGATGGGKLSGAGGEGLRGPIPPHVAETTQRLSGQQVEMIHQAERLKIAFQANNLPTYNLDRAVDGMKRIQSDLNNYFYQNIMPEQKVVLQNLKGSRSIAAKKVQLTREQEQSGVKKWQAQISQGMKETFPKGYEELVEMYFKKLAEH